MLSSGSLHFRTRHRLTHARQFQAVYGAKLRRTRGALVVSVVPNDLPHPRLGLSVGGRVGSAVIRSRTKRLIREAFRLLQNRLPSSPSGHYDIIVGVRSPAELTLAGLSAAMLELTREADAVCRRRAGRSDHSERGSGEGAGAGSEDGAGVG